MLRQGKKLLSWLVAASIVLSLLPVGVFSLEPTETADIGSTAAATEAVSHPDAPAQAPEDPVRPDDAAVLASSDDLRAVTAAAQRKTDEGETETITVTTANLFPITDQASLLFTVDGLSQGISWYADITVGDSEKPVRQYISKQNGIYYCSFSLNAPQPGPLSLKIQVVGNPSGNSPVSYDPVTLDIDLIDYSDFAPTLELTNDTAKPVHISMSRFFVQPLFPVHLLDGLNVSGFSAKLVQADAPDDGPVYAASISMDNSNSYSRQWYDTRYASVFPGVNSYWFPKYPTTGRSFTLYQSQPLVPGMYDLLVCEDGQEAPVFRVRQLVRVTDKPLISLHSYANYLQVKNTMGSDTAYGRLELSGASPEQFSLALYDGENQLGVSDRWAVEYTYAEQGSATYIYSIPLDSPLGDASYELRVLTDLDYETDQMSPSVYGNRYPQALDFYFSNHFFANLVGRITLPATPDCANYLNSQYRFELLLDNKLLATEYTFPSGDGYFDVEFHTEDGSPYPLLPSQSYYIKIYRLDENSSSPQWQQFSNFYASNYQVEAPTAALAADVNPVNYANAAICDGGTVETHLSLFTDTEFCQQLTDDNGFSFVLRRVSDPATPVYQLPAVVSDKFLSSDKTRVNYTVTAQVSDEVSDGYYYVDLYYHGALLVNPFTGKHILESKSPLRPVLFGYNPRIGLYSTLLNSLHFMTGFSPMGFEGATHLSIECFAQDNLTMEPDATLKWDAPNQDQKYVITPLHGKSLDLSKQYRLVYYLDGTPVSINSNYIYLLPQPERDDHTVCSVLLTQPEHGTLKLLPATPTEDGEIPLYSEVYVVASPDEGYQLKPGSVQVNGVSADGRGFLVLGDSTVTAEFEPVFVKTYTVTPYSSIYNGTLELSTDRAAAGETVYVTASPNQGYKVNSIQYAIGNGQRIDLQLCEDGRYCFTMPEGNVTLYASFTQIRTYTLSVYPNTYTGSYTITAGDQTSQGIVQSSMSILEGTEVTLTVTANSGYLVESLRYRDPATGQDVTLPAGTETYTYTFTMPDQDTSIRITYAQRQLHSILGDHYYPQGTVDFPDNAYAGDTVTVTVRHIDYLHYLHSLYYTVHDDSQSLIPILPDDTGTYSFVMPSTSVTIGCDIREKLTVAPYSDELGNQASVSGSYFVPGEQVTVYVYPASGYTLSELSYYSYQDMQSYPIYGDPDMGYSFVMPESSVQIQAQFLRMENTAPGGEVYDYDTLTAALGGADKVMPLYDSAAGEDGAGQMSGLILRYDTTLQSPIRVTGGDLTLMLDRPLTAPDGAFSVEGGQLKLTGGSSITASGAPAVQVSGGNLKLTGMLHLSCELAEGGSASPALSITGGSALIRAGELKGGVSVSGSGSLQVTGGLFQGTNRAPALLVGNTTGQVLLSGGEFFAIDKGHSIRLPEGSRLSDYIPAENVTVYLDDKPSTPEALSASSFTLPVWILKSYSIGIASDLEHVSIQAPASAALDQQVTVVIRPEDGYRVSQAWYTRDGKNEQYPLLPNSDGSYYFCMPDRDVTLHAIVEAEGETVLLRTSSFSALNSSLWSSFSEDVTQQLQPLQQSDGWKFLRVVLKNQDGVTVTAQEYTDLHSFQCVNLGLPAGRYQLFLTAGSSTATLPLGWQWITLENTVPYGGGSDRGSLTPYTRSFRANIWLDTSLANLPSDLTLEVVPYGGGQAVVSSRSYKIRQYMESGSAGTATSGKDSTEQFCELVFDVAVPTGLSAGQYALVLSSASMDFTPSDPSYPPNFMVEDRVMFTDGSFDPQTLLWSAKAEGLSAGSYSVYSTIWTEDGAQQNYYTLQIDEAGNASIQFPSWPFDPGQSGSYYLYLNHDDPDYTRSFGLDVQYYDNSQSNSWYAITLDNAYSYEGYMVWSEDISSLSGRLEGASGAGRYQIWDNQSGFILSEGAIDELSAFSIPLSGLEIRPQLPYRLSVYRGDREIGNTPLQFLDQPALCRSKEWLPNGVLFHPLNLTDQALSTLKFGYRSSQGQFELPVTFREDGTIYLSYDQLPYGSYAVWASYELTDESTGEPFREPLSLCGNDILYHSSKDQSEPLVQPLVPQTDDNGVTTASVTYVEAPGGDVTLSVYRQAGMVSANNILFEKTPFFVRNIGTGDYTISSETLEETGTFLFVFTLPDGTCISSQTLVFGQPSTVTVTFVDWNGAVLSAQTIQPGESAAAPQVPARDGYTFIGWKGSYQNVSRNTVVYAMYQKTTATVRFHLSGGQGSIPDQTVSLNGRLTAPAEPIREGYQFQGWSSTPNGPLWNFDATLVTSDMILYACWSKAEHPITIADDCSKYFSCTHDTAAAGEKVYFKYWLPDGKQFDQILLTRADGIAEYQRPDVNGEYWFIMPDQPVTLSAVITDASSSLSVRLENVSGDAPCSISLYGVGGYWYGEGASAQFLNLPAGPYTLSISHGSYWSSETIQVSGQTTKTVSLPDLYSVSGQIAPLPDSLNSFYLTVYGNDTGCVYYADVEQDGSFTLNDLPADTYTFRVQHGQGTIPVVSGEAVTLTSDNVTGHTIALASAADLQITLKTAEQTPAFRAYVNVYGPSGSWCGGGTTDGKNGTTLLLSSLLTQPGSYRLQLSSLLGQNYTGIPFVCEDVTVTVSEADISAGTVSAELVYSYPAKGTLSNLSGSGNLVTTDRSEAYPGEVVTLTIRYHNSGTQSLDASFTPKLPDGVEYYEADAQTSFTRTVAAGESGSIQVTLRLTENAANVLKIPVTVQVGGQSGDFGAALLSVSTLTLSAPVQVLAGDAFTVSGEAAPNSIVSIKNADTGLLLATVKASGRFYSAAVHLTATTSLVAQTDSYRSAPVPVEVVRDTPLTVDSLSYNGSKANHNDKLNAYSFWQYVNTDLMGYPLELNAQFSRSDITKVLFRFCDQTVSAKPSDTSWTATFRTWGGSGLKPITAEVTLSDGRTLTLTVAYVNLLIDPSGIVTDEYGQPLAGVSVTCQVLDENGVWVTWDAESSGQSNPIVTGEDGKYGWMVPEGTYRILASKDGYEDYDSLQDSNFTTAGGNSSIIIPPPRTDVNLTLKSKSFAIYPTASNQGTVELTASIAKVGETVTVTAQAEMGYVVSDIVVRTLKGDAVPVTREGSGFTFRMPASDVKVFGTYTSQALPAVEITSVSGDQVNLSLTSLNEDAQLVVALYDGGRMLNAATLRVNGSGTQQISISGAGKAAQIRAFLLTPSTQEPISAKTVWDRS